MSDIEFHQATAQFQIELRRYDNLINQIRQQRIDMENRVAKTEQTIQRTETSVENHARIQKALGK